MNRPHFNVQYSNRSSAGVAPSTELAEKVAAHLGG